MYHTRAQAHQLYRVAMAFFSLSTPARMSNPFASNPTLHPPPQQHRSRTVPFPVLTFPIPALAGGEEPELKRRRLGSPAVGTTAVGTAALGSKPVLVVKGAVVKPA